MQFKKQRVFLPHNFRKNNGRECMKERLHDSKSIWLHFLMWWLKFEQDKK